MKQKIQDKINHDLIEKFEQTHDLLIKKIDGLGFELYQTWLLECNPSLFSPMPSLTIVELVMQCPHLTSSVMIKEKTSLQSDDHYQWLTLDKTVINPLCMNQVRYRHCLNDFSLIFEFELNEGADIQEIDFKNFTLFINANKQNSFLLYYYLLNKVVKTRITADGNILQYNAENIIKPVESDENALEYSSFLLNNSNKILENYFIFPHKYLFVSFLKLIEMSWPEKVKKFTIECFFDKDLQLGFQPCLDTFKLHCIPVINLYSQMSEPMRIENKLRIHFQDQINTENPPAFIHHIERVICFDKKTREKKIYYPYLSTVLNDSSYQTFSARMVKNQEGESFYYINLNDNKDYQNKIIVCDLWLYQGLNPSKNISVGHSFDLENDHLSFIKAKIITKPTSSIEMRDIKKHPESIPFLLSNASHLLNKTLDFQLFLTNIERIENEKSLKQIQSIRSIDIELKQTIKKGMLIQIKRITVDIQQNGFNNTAELYFFGSILYIYLSKVRLVNQCIELIIQCDISKEPLKWSEL